MIWTTYTRSVCIQCCDKALYSFHQSIRELFLPNRCWGPALPKHRALMSSYLRDDQFVVDPHSENADLTAGPVKVGDSDE